MKFIRAMAVLFVAGISFRAASATAQTPGQPRYDAGGYNSPPVSPYLLLLPQATSTGGFVNTAPGTYQSLVRPLLDARDEKLRQSPSSAQISPSSASGPQMRNAQTTGFANGVRPTGHSATFLNTSHYYPAQRP